MVPTKFHLFPSLPLELRQKIYMLATAPRVVHIQECTKEEYDDFVEAFCMTPVQVKLDPTLAYFAFIWRRHMPFRSGQSTLESFGFSGGKPPHQPWEPSTSTPHIPLTWLGEHPEVAWELTRESFLYSNAPIPPLLHTCSESRAELMSRGYQLAFRTRSSQPRTWFNFDQDVLFLKFNPDRGLPYYCNFLSDGPWDVGQFDPRDMQRVRKLALDHSAELIRPHSVQFGVSQYEREASTVLRLFGGLKELLLVEWNRQDLARQSEFSPSSKNRHKEQDATDSAREICSCIAIEEIDALLYLFLPESIYLSTSSAGERGELLKAHKQTNGPTAPFFRDMELRLEERLGNRRDSVIATNNDGSVTPWEIPKITTVHVLPRSMFCFLSEVRLRAVDELCKLKTEWASTTKLKASTSAASSASAAPSASAASSALPASSASEWQDDEEAFAAAHYYCDQCEEDWYGWSSVTDEQKNWWIQEGPVPALSGHDIYW
ncbi:hypothetical protein DL771_007847 [Monosporascus sp. 5C6A]|nr:hypothetical protein DL771_007847 [Monosporascus sp. 5C6A]